MALDRRHGDGAGRPTGARSAGFHRPGPARRLLRAHLRRRPGARLRARHAHPAAPTPRGTGELADARAHPLRGWQPRQRGGDARRAPRRVVRPRPRTRGGAGHVVGRGDPRPSAGHRGRGGRRRHRGALGPRRTVARGCRAGHPGRAGTGRSRAGGRRALRHRALAGFGHPRQRTAHPGRRHRPVRRLDAARHHDDLAAALWATAEGFGDVDTTCAITGGIVGARTGVDAVPREWLERREGLG